MNLRKWIYFSLVGLRGQPLGKYYHQLLHEYRAGISPDISQKLLKKLLQHCERNVPYYSKLMKEIGTSFYNDPIDYLNKFPVLTKNIVRSQFNELKSIDLHRRRWYLNCTGGSTGEPVQFIQDWEYSARSGAISALYSKLLGIEIGDHEVHFWGSERDIVRNMDSWRAQLINRLTNTTLINSVLMTSERMYEFINILNMTKPKLIVAYVESIYELAKFADNLGLIVLPQSTIMTAAGKLFPFMRKKIEKVFQCKVFDRYGSREVGNIACERPGFDGLWVAPWGNYLEIVDPEGNLVADGFEGEILVTSLTNYAMPLLRYKIGDRGVISSLSHNGNNCFQVLKEVTGRSMDFFKIPDGSLINPGFFMANLYFRNWIMHYQIIQKSYNNVTYRIVKLKTPPQKELDDIEQITKRAMGPNCEVTFEFVEEISISSSGKYRFLISEVSK